MEIRRRRSVVGAEVRDATEGATVEVHNATEGAAAEVRGATEGAAAEVRGAIVILGVYLLWQYAARYRIWVRTVHSATEEVVRGHAVQQKEICGYTQRSGG